MGDKEPGFLEMWTTSLSNHTSQIAVLFLNNFLVESLGGCANNDDTLLEGLVDPMGPVKEILMCSTSDVAKFDTWKGKAFTDCYFQ